MYLGFFVFTLVILSNIPEKNGSIENNLDNFLYKELSPATYFGMKNATRKTNDGDFKSLHAMSRRDYSAFQQRFRLHPHNWTVFNRMCVTLGATYRTGLTDIYLHYKYRQLFWGTPEYEIGYTVYNLVSKYQQMVEIYNMVIKHYVMHNNTKQATPYYLLYLYSCMVGFQKAIAYMGNALRELKNKYKGAPDTVFGPPDIKEWGPSDEDENDTETGETDWTGPPEGLDMRHPPTQSDFMEDRKRKRQDERDRQKNEERKYWNFSKVLNWTRAPRTKPKRGRWPIDRYGWDVELYEGQIVF